MTIRAGILGESHLHHIKCTDQVREADFKEQKSPSDSNELAGEEGEIKTAIEKGLPDERLQDGGGGTFLELQFFVV